MRLDPADIALLAKLLAAELRSGESPAEWQEHESTDTATDGESELSSEERSRIRSIVRAEKQQSGSGKKSAPSQSGSPSKRRSTNTENG